MIQHSEPTSEDQNNFVSVVIPVYNEERYLECCLNALTRSLANYPNSEMIVVDNGSTDRSVEIAKTFTDKVFVHTDCNVGAVRNYGVTHAKGDVLAFLDSDCTVESNWVSSGLELIRSDDNVIAGGSLRVRKNAGWVERLWLLQDVDNQFTQTDLLGSCTFVDKAHFNSLQGFSETVSSGEDSDFSVRAKKAGFRVEISDRLNVVHLGNPTSLYDFIQRQAWHAENYISQIAASVKDVVFWLVIAYLSGLLATTLSLLTPLVMHFWYLLALILPAVILGIKRIIRSGFTPDSLLDLSKIFILDNCYLLGRSLGIIRGLVRSVSRR